jgi:hypothetical protein
LEKANPNILNPWLIVHRLDEGISGCRGGATLPVPDAFISAGFHSNQPPQRGEGRYFSDHLTGQNIIPGRIQLQDIATAARIKMPKPTGFQSAEMSARAWIMICDGEDAVFVKTWPECLALLEKEFPRAAQ